MRASASPPFLRITSANTREEAYEFVYDIEGSVPIDIASATPRLFLKKWCHVKVKRSIGFSRLHQSRASEEEWTIMLRNEHDDYFFGLSSDICVYVAGNRYLPPSNYWTVGSSHVSNSEKLLAQI